MDPDKTGTVARAGLKALIDGINLLFSTLWFRHTEVIEARVSGSGTLYENIKDS